MRQLKKKLPNRAYILFVMYEGNFAWYKKNTESIDKFLESIKNHKS